MPPIQPSSSSGPSKSAAGRGFRGLFSRARVVSPEPAEPISTRSRLRSFVSDAAKGGSSFKPTAQGRQTASKSIPKVAVSGERQRTLSSEVASGKQKFREEPRRGMPPRPATPTERTARLMRMDPTALPALQKGKDGKWQPPSLSRGSLSTSALHLLQQDERNETGAGMTAQDDQVEKKRDKEALSNLFQATSRNRAIPPPISVRPSTMPPNAATATSADANDLSRKHDTPNTNGNQPDSPPSSPTGRLSKSPADSRTIQPYSKRPSLSSPTSSSPVSSSVPSQSANFRPSRARAATGSPPTAKRSSPASTSMGPPPIPSHTRHDSAPTSLLSRDHYLLRLSTSFVVKTLIPVVRGSAFAQSERNAEMRRLADKRLQALGRMEKAWGADWFRVAGELMRPQQSGAVSDSPEIESTEAKVRLVHVGERAKERERKAWSDAMKDGILLCFLLNQLFPSHPSHIPRLNISEDGLSRGANVTRFLEACQTVGLSSPDIFAASELQECSEVSAGRVAHTIIALARSAGRENAAVSRSRSPPGSRSNSRPPSRNTTATASPPRSPPASPRRLVHTESRLKRTSGDGQPVTYNMAQLDHGTNDLHVKLSVVTDNKPAVDLDDPSAWRTPTTTTFSLPPDPFDPTQKRTPLTRATTQPNLSPALRPKSPTPSPSSRSITPVGRAQVRPVLRPRNTTGGSRASVTFAEDDVNAIRLPPDEPSVTAGQVELSSHSRERTPSLISSGSRVTSSAYTRSSGVLSVATILGEDYGSAVDLAEDDGYDGVQIPRLRERRASEKRLQDARERILGTLLSNDHLNDELPKAKSDEARDTALSRSLAALEGNRISPRAMRIDSSPRHRPSARRGQSLEAGRQDVGRVLEEDEQDGDRLGAPTDDPRPIPMRRLSSSSRVYVPKRSISPATSRATSPTTTEFPLSTSVPTTSYLHMVRSPSLNPSQTTTSHLGRPTDRAERRQSDGHPVHSHSRDQTMASEDSSRPMQLRISSMVNLSTMGSPSVFRENSSQSVLRTSQQLQVLEFHESGRPVVRYQLGNCIGRGQFGSVYRSLNLGTGQMVAIKRIRLHGMREDEVTDVMREVELLQRMSHPSIVKYEGMSRDQDYLNIVLEFVENGSLGQTLKAFGKFNEKLVSSYVAKILEGLDYLHSQGVVHCDLKAANILSTKNGNVKLSDFGVSLNLKAVENIKQDAKTAGKAGGAKKRASEVAGTPNWMAPEVISLTGASFASDIWSLGCTIIELLTGKPPYAEITNSMSVLFHIVEDDMPPMPSDISDELTDFLKLCFVKDPKLRPSAAAMFEHPWVKALSPELALRPQDSVPFLRRVSMDLRRVDSARLFDNEGNDSTTDLRRHRHSMASSHGREGSDGMSTKTHVLIKTTFGKAIVCRVCHLGVKKVGVLCQDCGLIAHTACASDASPRCDIHEQYEMLSRQQEMGLSPLPDDPVPTTLPVKILNGLKRSKTAILASSTSQVALMGAVTQNSTDNRFQSQAYGRQSLETNMSSRSASLQNRSSMYSNTSEYDGDGRRRTEAQYHLGEMGLRSTATIDEGDKVVQVGVVPVPAGGVGGRKGHTRNKESKSDCCIM
nr:uncharacterized protein CI109_003193 [Kwoniella shandongensis]KAA5528295.1 hypothetical protein CI109_003193 [Kwoniella shandongensis]